MTMVSYLAQRFRVVVVVLIGTDDVEGVSVQKTEDVTRVENGVDAAGLQLFLQPIRNCRGHGHQTRVLHNMLQHKTNLFSFMLLLKLEKYFK